jgi:uncharacterized membrane protein
MTTPIIMLAILCLPMAVVALPWARSRGYSFRTAGAVGLGLLFLFTASGHFLLAEPMAQMIPPWVPARDILVFLTGFLELAIAAALFHPATRRPAGIAAAAVLVGFFPFNVYAAVHHVPMGGHAWGPVYLLIRAPLQAILLAWAGWFVIRRGPAGASRT